ncbi:DExH-box splicing factor binding site-domain-containing protein [Xylariomycetidae sp. FL2044]|nr:DExH-box splicing factor binding site-domain-containing protein [Xylariomycetidae sp. FL2044]
MSDSIPASQTPTPRIAIKFGSASASPKTNNGTRKVGKPQPPSTLGKRHRPSALGHDSDSDNSDDSVGRQEVVTSFGADLPSNGKKKRDVKDSRTGVTTAPYVISGHKNRDWKAEARAQGSRVAPSKVNGPSKDTEPADQDKDIKWGLNVTTTQVRQEGSAHPDNGMGQLLDSQTTNFPPEDAGADSPNHNDQDKDAIDALLGKRRNPAKDIVIQSRTHNGSSSSFTDADAYKRKMEEAAEIPTMEEYEEIPEGEFGAAMLRGMGWNGEERGSKLKVAKKRPNLMGLGSTEDEEIKKAELAKKHGYRERRPRLNEYKDSRERERRDRDERHRDSYKAERDRERERDRHRHGTSHRHRDRDRNDHPHRSREYR